MRIPAVRGTAVLLCLLILSTGVLAADMGMMPPEMMGPPPGGGPGGGNGAPSEAAIVVTDGRGDPEAEYAFWKAALP